MHLPILRAGQPYTSLDRLAVAHIATGQPLAQVSQANRGLIARGLSRPRAQPPGTANPHRRRIGRHLPTGRRPLLTRRAPFRRRRPNPGRLRRASLGHHWPAAVASPRQHGQNPPRRRRNARRAQRPNPRPRPNRPRRRPKSAPLRVPRPSPRLHPAEQLAWRPCPVAASHPAQNPAGAQAGPRRTVDALPHRPSPDRGRLSAPSPELLPDRPTAAAPKSCSTAIARCYSAAALPSPLGATTLASNYTDQDAAKSSSARTKSTTGNTTSTSWSPQSLPTGAAPASTPPASGCPPMAAQSPPPSASA